MIFQNIRKLKKDVKEIFDSYKLILSKTDNKMDLNELEGQLITLLEEKYVVAIVGRN